MKNKDIFIRIIKSFLAFIAGAVLFLLFVYIDKSRLCYPFDSLSYPFASFLGGITGIISYLWFLKNREYARNLRKTEAKYRQMVENINDVIFSLDNDGRITYMSPVVSNYSGYEADALIGKLYRDYIHPEDIEEVNLSFENTLQGLVEPVEYRVLAEPGKYLWVRSFSRPKREDDIVTGLSGVINNINEKKLSEEALEKSEDSFRRIAESVNDGLIIFKNGRVFFMNGKAREIFQTSIGEHYGIDVLDLIPLYLLEDGRDKVLTEVENLRNFSSDGGEVEFWMQDESGEEKFIHCKVSTTIDQIQGVTRYGIMRNMTEWKRSEERLRLSEEKFRIVFHNAGDAIFIHDIDGRIFEVNKVAESRLGYSMSELSKMKVQDFVSPEFFDTMPSCMSDLKKREYAFRETQHVSKDGTLIPSELNSCIIEYSGKKEILSIVRDIRERKKLEDEILKTDRLESIGVLAGGIAHDFNNILMAILGNISLMKMHVCEDEEIYDFLSDAENASWRAKELTHQLLTFAKGGSPVKKTVSIGEFIVEVANFALRGTNFISTFSISDDLFSVEVDAGQMSQVLHNLIINAQQAMLDGGEIEISAENLFVSEKDDLPLSEGMYVRISVRDYGHGVPNELISKIFDPFFTTKVDGSGLGLATSYSIIRKHDGHITAVVPDGGGMLFNLYLPAVQEESCKEEKATKLCSGKGDILLMDDDPEILKVAGNMIEHLGFRVVFAGDGVEARSIYREAREAGNNFEAIIMDLTVPGGMGGCESVKFLKNDYPDAKVIVSSGYSNDPVLSAYKKFGFDEVILKPYKLEELSEVLSSVLT